MNRKILMEMLVRHEGCKLKPYTDTVGKITIGVGRNLTDVGIDNDEAQLLLLNDIDRAMDELDSRLPWWRNLDSARQIVVVNMCFNLGITKLCKFKNTLRYLQIGEYDNAAINMSQSLWAKQVKGRAMELSDIIRTGKL